MRTIVCAALAAVAVVAPRVGAEPITGLTTTGQLVTFDSATPG